MKTLIGLILILTLAVPAYAQLSVQEETDIKDLLKSKAQLDALIAEKDNLVNISKNLDLETVPLQIAQLRIQRDALIVARDAELKAEDIKCQDAKEIIRGTYASQINDVDSLIQGLQSQLNP